MDLVQKARELVERKRQLIRKNTELFLENRVYAGADGNPEEYEEKLQELTKESKMISAERIKIVEEAKQILKILDEEFFAMVREEGEKAQEEIRSAIIERVTKKPEEKEFPS